MPDIDGYPTKKELEKIKKWDFKDPMGLMNHVEELWNYPDRFVLTGKRVLRLYLSTGGWSGNESIIEALQQNPFWYFYWQKSQRGGHYWFKIKLTKSKKEARCRRDQD